MSDRNPSDTRQRAAQAVRLAASRRGVGQFARLGYFAIGAVYAAIGVLAMLGVLGVGSGQYTGSFGAVRALVAQPYGRVILFVLAAGVGTYAAWRVAQSVFDVEGRGSGTSGLLKRGGLLVSALTYLLLIARIVFQLIATSMGDEARAEAASWTQPLMNHPAGLVLVGLAGVVMLGVAGVQFRSAYGAGFLDQMNTSRRSRRWVGALGRFGFFARGVVFSIMAVFLIISAIRTSPDSARGLGGALQTLGQQTYGPFLIGVVAVGLFSYGLFMLAKARFRHLAPGTPHEDDRARDAGEEPADDASTQDASRA